jgi:hypothetical protein
VARDRVFEPDAGCHAAYMDLYAKYRDLYPLLRGFLRRL